MTWTALATTAGSESGQINWRVTVAGIATNKLILSNTVLGPFADDGLALGAAGTAYSDLFLASGAVINFASGNVTMTHSSHGLKFGNTVSRIVPNADTTAASSATYAFGINNSADSLVAMTFGYDGTSALIQSWSVPLVINGQGNAVKFSGVGTTASAANAFLDNAAGNSLLRSTSSIRYKTDVTDLSEVDTETVDRLRPIKYRSIAAADNPDRWHFGFIAEEVAAVDDRLIFVNEEGQPEGVQYDRVVPLLVAQNHELMARVAALEAKL
jgi:hypothetical protein